MEDKKPIVPVWVCLENLPIVLFHKEALLEVGKLLGKPVRMDGYIANKSKVNQANICIEMDVYKPVKDQNYGKGDNNQGEVWKGS